MKTFFFLLYIQTFNIYVIYILYVSMYNYDFTDFLVLLCCFYMRKTFNNYFVLIII